MRKRILPLFAFVLGFIGAIGCAVAFVGVWTFNAKLVRTSENLFETITDSLVGVQQRIVQIQERVQAAKITVEEIDRRFKQWIKAEASESLVSQLEIKELAERLLVGLQQASQLLELSESSVQLVQQALLLGQSLGISGDVPAAEHLLEKIAALQAQLAEVEEMAQRIQQRAAGEELRTAGGRALAELLVRVAATLGAMDALGEGLQERISEMQSTTDSARVAALRWIRITAVSFTLLLCWLAVGQGALCYLGWKGFRRQPAPVAG